nr:MAG TPA: hypothetical protein [Caudoviricetes sp.]
MRRNRTSYMKSYGSKTYYHTSRVRFLQNLKTVLASLEIRTSLT